MRSNALTSSGNAFRVPDEFEVYFQAEHFVDAGDISVPQTLTIAQGGRPILFGKFGLDGRPYAPYGSGHWLDANPPAGNGPDFFALHLARARASMPAGSAIPVWLPWAVSLPWMVLLLFLVASAFRRKSPARVASGS